MPAANASTAVVATIRIVRRNGVSSSTERPEPFEGEPEGLLPLLDGAAGGTVSVIVVNGATVGV